jgi:hypothetical protein
MRERTRVAEMRRQLTAAAGMLALAVGVTACQIGHTGVINTPSIRVVTPTSSEKAPFVEAILHMKVLTPPRGGTVRMDLNYYSKPAKKWEFAGRDMVAIHHWKAGQVHLLIVDYPCLRSGLRWRMYVVWEGVAANGKPEAGHRYWPNRTTGKKLTC